MIGCGLVLRALFAGVQSINLAVELLRSVANSRARDNRGARTIQVNTVYTINFVETEK